MNKEDTFLKIINETVKDNSYLGDDCAYIKNLNLLISQDTLYEDIHFSFSYFTPYTLGKKAVLVNISDIFAGGGIPLYITISLSGDLDEGFIKEFYEGVNEIIEKYNIKLIGGDLTGGNKTVISISIIGYTKNPSGRKNAQFGYNLYLAGFHGSSAMGLKLLQEGCRDYDNELIKAHIEPVLYPEISNAVMNNAKDKYAMTDTSDGLFNALDKIRAESKTGFDIQYDKILKQVDDKNLVLFGGEDYGLLIALSSDDSQILDKFNIPKIGTVTNTNKIIIDGKEIIEDKSFNHFK